jgi:hypothetical protein
MKLESLKDKPATEKDIGKTIYHSNGEPCFLHGTLDLKHVNNFKDSFYWQKPILVSEDEIRALAEAIRNLNIELSNNIKKKTELMAELLGKNQLLKESYVIFDEILDGDPECDYRIPIWMKEYIDLLNKMEGN